MRRITGVALALAMAAPAVARDLPVHGKDDFPGAVRAAQPGDAIVLADGVWRDFPMLFTGQGTEAKPITLRAETPGKVIIAGASSLRIAGKWLVVRGLVFRDGATPTDEVISFRNGRNAWAEHVRLTETVIDRYNQADRRKEDHWIALAGTDNRIDHSHFEGKANNGAMMVVLRDKPLPLDNRLRIDHNYFGPRPVLGMNGGETIRIGTSTESQSDSHTIVEDNVFEECDGEVEIISVKSGADIVRRNLFLRSQGSVVLRHGNGNLVENNVFLGGDVAHTGGVRVINLRQTVRGNYMEGLAGEDFRSAITVMNGVPNSPINRYVPVEDALIEGNTVVGIHSVVLFGAGADQERSAPPRTTRFERNLLVTPGDPFKADGSTGGISFAGDVASGPVGAVGSAVSRRAVPMTRAGNGLLYPTDPALADVGAPRSLRPVTKAEVGVAWYAKNAGKPIAFGVGRTLPQVADPAGLARAVAAAGDGDTVPLKAGDYRITAPLVISHAITLSGPSVGHARLLPAVTTLFRIENGGALRLARLAINGTAAPVTMGSALIRTGDTAQTANYAVELEDCAISGLTAPAYDVIAPKAGSLAETITIRRSAFDGVTGAIVAGREEMGSDGWYTAEQVTFDHVAANHVGTIVDLLRRGNDESTLGPRFTMTHSTVTDSGPVLLDGAQSVTIASNALTRSAGVRVTHTVGYPHTAITGNAFTATPAPAIREAYWQGPARALVADNQVTR